MISKKFHLPGCDAAKKIKEPSYTAKNKNDLLKEGYDGCKKCNA